MKRIPLTQGQFALVDDEDFERVNAFKWCANWNKFTKSYYAIRFEGKRGSRKPVLMHRFIMNTPKHLVCDHINHKTLENYKNNLRNCSQSMNVLNIKTRGIKRNIRLQCKKYQVSITLSGKIIYKAFPTLEEAIAFRDKTFEDFWATNFPYP